jgi:glycosyltransferase involved in cell wall biosynthesis
MLGLVFLLFQLGNTIRTFRPDLIHAHSTFAGAIVRFLALFLPRMPKIVYCPHGWVFDTARSSGTRRWMEAAERIQSRRCAAIVSISYAEKAAGEAAGISPEKLIVIPNGLRPSARIRSSTAWDDHRIKALFVGRLDRQKGVDVLIEAVRNLQDSVCVRIVGESVVARQDSRSSLANVEYLGWLDQDAVASQIEACDLVVMPSRWEGFGLVAIEAMRAAKPVIASAVGGLVEIVVDGVTGRLVPVGNSSALSEALVSSSREQLLQMGRTGRERFLARYSIDKTHSNLMSLYQRLLSHESI